MVSMAFANGHVKVSMARKSPGLSPLTPAPHALDIYNEHLEAMSQFDYY